MADKHQRIIAHDSSSSECVLDTCCCCISLKTGCFVLGYLQLVGLVMGGLYAFFIVAAGIVTINSEAPEDMQEKRYTAGLAMVIVGAALMAIVVITLPFAIVLLVGLHKEERKYVKIYLIFAVVGIIITVMLNIAKLVLLFNIETIISALISFALNVYFFLVIRSQYIKMGQGNVMPYQQGQGIVTHKL